MGKNSVIALIVGAPEHTTKPRRHALVAFLYRSECLGVKRNVSDPCQQWAYSGRQASGGAMGNGGGTDFE